MISLRSTDVLPRVPWVLPAAVAGFLLWRPATQGPTICPFALATGHACPLCGGTRAAAALVRGDLTLAWDMHPLIFLVVPLLAFLWVSWVGRRMGRFRAIPMRTYNLALAGLGLAFLAVWAIRLAAGTLPPI